jgi:hypothetical protein
LDGPHDRATLQGFVAFQAERWRWGLQYSNQDRQDDLPLALTPNAVITAYDRNDQGVRPQTDQGNLTNGSCPVPLHMI